MFTIQNLFQIPSSFFLYKASLKSHCYPPKILFMIFIMTYKPINQNVTQEVGRDWASGHIPEELLD